MAKSVKVGEKIPNFKVDSSEGGKFNLTDNAGKNLVLFFYPKDSTPGCTIEGHEFNKLLNKFKKTNTEIFGVSRDKLSSHEKFINSCGFKFPLLSDVDESLCKLFDVIKEKNMYGKKVMGIERSTFVIDANQNLVAEFRKVKAPGHAQEILDWVQENL